jgi:hypothetical protein
VAAVSRQKTIILVVVLAVGLVSVIAGVSYQFFTARIEPFEASFDPNPLIIASGESEVSILTIAALEAAELGKYRLFVHTGNSEQTGLAGATVQLTVTSAT